MENLSSKSNITAAGGYFLMSLTIHLAFQTICAAGDALCVRDPDMWVCGGDRNAFGSGNISCLEGKNCGPATAEISRIGLPALAHIPENYDSTVATMFKCPSSLLPGEPAYKMHITMFTVLVASLIIFSSSHKCERQSRSHFNMNKNIVATEYRHCVAQGPKMFMTHNLELSDNKCIFKCYMKLHSPKVF